MTRHSAFTLVELMLSLAMVLLLIIGINYVFRSATDAVSAGQNLNQINSDAQATQPLLFDDFQNATKNPPCFIIASQLVNQYLNGDDAKTSSDPKFIPLDNAGGKVTIGNGPSGFLSPAILNYRNHRADLIKFFAHYLYHRRSGNDGSYTGSETSDDAWIEIGHAALPANDLSNFYGPSNLPILPGKLSTLGLPGVPRIGAFASDWVLARRITLLSNAWQNPTVGGAQPITATDSYYSILPNAINPNAPTTIAGAGFPFGVNMSPLSYGTPDYNNNTNTSQNALSQTSRYDIAGVTPEQFDRIIANAILGWQTAGYSGTSLWWNSLINSIPVNQTTATPPQSSTLNTAPYTVPYNNAVPNYVSAFPRGGTKYIPNVNGTILQTFGDPGLWLNRPQCNPLIQTPVTAAALAEMSPYFLQHCSQFAVEYAGDYLQQDNNPSDVNYSNMTGIGPDGQIDYYLDANGNKHTRWYGMPRSSTGSSHNDGFGNQVLIRGFDSTIDTLAKAPSVATPQPMSILLNYFTDVIPLRDYYSMWFATFPPTPAAAAGSYSPPWEVDVNFDPTRDYGSLFSAPSAAGPNKTAFNAPNNPPRYVAAWHDDTPAMIRILIKLDDPNNKVKDGPWYEYVFRLK
ncbi:MAG TPA: type II secretion system protein [Tepidisphaeraceae bacterium]